MLIAVLWCVVPLVFCTSGTSPPRDERVSELAKTINNLLDVEDFTNAPFIANDRSDLSQPDRKDNVQSPTFVHEQVHNDTVTEERSVTSEKRNDGIHHKVTITKKIRVPYTIHVEKRIPKIIEVPVDKPFNVYVPKPYPVVVEKKVPYEIKVRVPQPYTVEKKVPYPVKVLVDKPYTIHVPKPYPVEVDKKVEFTVEKKVPYEVKVPVERPYPVHVIVEKEVKFPIEKKVPVPVKVPYDMPIPIHIERHIPVHIDQPVPYTVEKVSTVPVRVPLEIPIKFHYPERGSMESFYLNHESNSGQNQNTEWTKAMAGAEKAIKGFEQHRSQPFFPQSFSGSSTPHFSMQSGRFYMPGANSLKPSKSFFHGRQQINFGKLSSHNVPHPAQTPQVNPSYEVKEDQSSENYNGSPLQQSTGGKDQPNVQLLSRKAPQLGSIMLTQAVKSVGSGRNIFNSSNEKAFNRVPESPTSIKVSHVVRHNAPPPPSSVSPQLHYNVGEHFQTVQFGKSLPTAFSVYGHKEKIHAQTNQGRTNVPSATYFQPGPHNATSFPKLIVPPPENPSPYELPAHFTSASVPKFKPLTPDGPKTNSPPGSGQVPYDVLQSSNPTAPPTTKQDPHISSSFVGSKTFSGHQEHQFSTSIQHN